MSEPASDKLPDNNGKPENGKKNIIVRLQEEMQRLREEMQRFSERHKNRKKDQGDAK